MSWRTVVVSTRSKLDFRLGFMVIRNHITQKVFLDDVAVLMIENPAVALTGCLLEELVKRKIKVIFCDSKRNPAAELVPCHGNYEGPGKLRDQLSWPADIKEEVWLNIVTEKIRNQALFLQQIKRKEEASMLFGYINEIESGDVTNREGHAAKVYFNAVFGKDFSRSSRCNYNSALNYGYAVILSAFNREIAACGYLTQLGLFHDNMFNHFNLSCDFMEPYRILIDREVYEMNLENFGPEEKHKLINILNKVVQIKKSQQTVLNAVRIYVRSIFRALINEDITEIENYSLEK